MESDAWSIPEILSDSVPFPEILVVSPTYGRFHGGSFESGATIEAGTVIGVVQNVGPEVDVVCHARGVFLSWLAWADERVSPGVPLARIAPLGV